MPLSVIAQASPDSELMATLQDQMCETLNALAGYMDFRTDTDNTGQIDLLTPGGLRLVEGAPACWATASGMAAVSGALSSMLKAGDHVVASIETVGSLEFDII